MGDTLSRMADMQDRHPSGRPLDAPHTTLVAQEVPSRLERIATQLMAGMMANPNCNPSTQWAIDEAKELIEALDREGNQ